MNCSSQSSSSKPATAYRTSKKKSAFSILTNLFDDVRYPDLDFVPCFEALEDHGTFYEILFIFGDGDDAIEIFIPKTGVDNDLLSMCSQFAVVLN